MILCTRYEPEGDSKSDSPVAEAFLDRMNRLSGKLFPFVYQLF